jgi:hypothetical protein
LETYDPMIQDRHDDSTPPGEVPVEMHDADSPAGTPPIIMQAELRELIRLGQQASEVGDHCGVPQADLIVRLERGAQVEGAARRDTGKDTPLCTLGQDADADRRRGEHADAARCRRAHGVADHHDPGDAGRLAIKRGE